MALQPVALGALCAQCLRLTGESHRMEVYLSGYLCPVCKTFHPTKRERGRAAVASYLRIAGFFLLVLASVLYSKLNGESELIWMGFLAGYSFYFLTILQNTKATLMLD